MSEAVIACGLTFLALSVLGGLLWLNGKMRRERRYFAKPLSATDIIDRAKNFRMPGLARALMQSDPSTAGALERELRQLAALLAINSGEHYLMPPGLQSAWDNLVSEHKEFTGFCELLLGAGGIFTQAQVPQNANWDIPAARDKFAESYAAAFGCKLDPNIWENNSPTTAKNRLPAVSSG